MTEKQDDDTPPPFPDEPRDAGGLTPEMLEGLGMAIMTLNETIQGLRDDLADLKA